MVEPTGAIHIYGGDFSDYSNFSCLDPGVSVCRSFGLEERRMRYVDLDVGRLSYRNNLDVPA